MIEFEKENWEIYDPDEVLNSENIDAAEQLVDPREDVLQFSHKKKDLIVDFGFYANETSLGGEWIVYLIKDKNWVSPFQKHRFDTFKAGVKSTIGLLNEFST